MGTNGQPACDPVVELRPVSMGKAAGNTLFYYNSYRDGVNFRQMYAKYYAETATYTIGRQSRHWGMGAIFNEGARAEDRFASIEDGVKADFDVGNFRLSPYYMKINGNRGDVFGSGRESTSTGVALLYRGSERNLTAGVLYEKRKSGDNNTFFKGAAERPESEQECDFMDQEQNSNSPCSLQSPGDLGGADVAIVDLYFQKGFGRFDVELEIPLISGNFGKGEGKTDYSASGFVGKVSYELDPRWTFEAHGGRLSGASDDRSSFEALYLHPNFHVANLMFRYHLDGADLDSVFDSYMTNMSFVKIAAIYQMKKWEWAMALILASAEETAKAGETFFRHEQNAYYPDDHLATKDQAADYGFEADVDFKYAWNSNVDVMGSLGYHFVGDYYSFGKSSTTNAYAFQLKTIVHF